LHELKLHGQPLDLDLTLSCGQAFRWSKRPDGVWTGVVGDKLIELAIRGDVLRWRTSPDDDPDLVVDYLRLGDDVKAIYARLSDSDPHLAGLIREFHGLRLLRQDPAETLLSFVCSAANSIPRITAAIEALAQRHGELVCEIGGLCHYTFPTIEQVACCDCALLDRTELLGFRDRHLREVARQVMVRGEGWLMSLREASHAQAREQLTTLRGVGRKIADCVCLFALDKDEAVPVDTHIRQLAERLWMPELEAKSITESVCNRIVDEFTKRYGSLAGWAQQFLFYEDLARTRALGRGLGKLKS
jgi:N-glycosylase/DNA lyase